MMLWLDMILRSYVIIEPHYIFGRWNSQFHYLFNNYVVVTDVTVIRPDVIKAHIIYCCHCGS